MTSKNWSGNYEYRATKIESPGSIEELQHVVSASDRIKALGSRHSFNDVADSPATQVSLTRLPAIFEVDADSRTVTVGGGLRFGEFAQRLSDGGWALHNLASLPHISVAGAIATGTHGSGDRNGTLPTAVAALEFVTATGESRRLVRGDTGFDGAVVSLGALGVVTAVSLDIEPTFDVRQDVFENLGWAELREHFDEITSSAYSVSVFTLWGDVGGTTVWLKSRLDGDTTAADRDDLFGAVRQTTELHPLPGGPSANATQQSGVPGPWWDRLAHFRMGFTPSAGEELQTEYLVPREHAVAAIDAMRALGPAMAPYLLISEIRTMRADDLWLSPAYGHDTVGLHFTWTQEEAVFGLLPAIDAALAPFRGRPHWGKVFDIDSSRLDSLYPRLADFRGLAEQMDPSGKFRNAYLDRTIFAG
ncbi:MAG: FAD-binding protein [Microbacteriaceae bacterium]|nr:FAD-binding protein [Microbacteriaceae bacterium]